ncbi:MAG: peptidylprolyl isomerase [Spirochaetia bacterium]|nr:peptidylprolyl isomerase [Spirochaetia bacterium]
MFNVKLKSISISVALVLATLISGNCNNKVLAKYEGGEIRKKEIVELAKMYNVESRLENPEFISHIVQDYAVIKILSEKASVEQLDKSKEALYLNTLFNGNILRNVLYQIKQDEFKEEKEPVFHARHILIKVTNSASNPKDKTIKTSDGSKEYETIIGIRNDILNKKITFEEAASKYSEDEGSKVKQGDLGYFTKGIMVGDFETALLRMSGDLKGTPMRVAVNKLKMLSKPEGADVNAAPPEKDSIVMVLENNVPPGWSKIQTDSFTVYVPSNELKSIEDESKLSAPVRSVYGWHLIQLVDKKNVDENGYAKLIKKNELKGEKDADSIAASRAKMYWSRLKGTKLSEWQKQLYTDYGLNFTEYPALDNKWQSSENLLGSEKLKITGNELKDFINWIAQDQGVEVNSILSDKESMQRYFKIYADLQLYILEGEKLKVKESKLFKEKSKFERQQFLAELYKKKHWYPEVSYTEKDLQNEYNTMKQNKPAHIKTMPPFSQIKSEIIRQVKGRQINMLGQQKTQELLASLKFNFTDKAIKSPETVK